jgi:hypothetical protein
VSCEAEQSQADQVLPGQMHGSRRGSRPGRSCAPRSVALLVVYRRGEDGQEDALVVAGAVVPPKGAMGIRAAGEKTEKGKGALRPAFS